MAPSGDDATEEGAGRGPAPGAAPIVTVAELAVEAQRNALAIPVRARCFALMSDSLHVALAAALIAFDVIAYSLTSTLDSTDTLLNSLLHLLPPFPTAHLKRGRAYIAPFCCAVRIFACRSLGGDNSSAFELLGRLYGLTICEIAHAKMITNKRHLRQGNRCLLKQRDGILVVPALVIGPP